MWRLVQRLPFSTRLAIMQLLQRAVLWLGDRIAPEVPTRNLREDSE